MSLLFNTPSGVVIAFLPRSKCLLISWLKSPSAVILEPKKIKFVTVSVVSSSICHDLSFSNVEIYPSRNTHSNIFKLFTELKSRTNGGHYHFFYSRLKEPEKLKKLSGAILKEQPDQIDLRLDERSAGIAHAMILIINPTLESFSPSPGTHTFDRPAVSPFVWQSNRTILLFFIPNSFSEI